MSEPSPKRTKTLSCWNYLGKDMLMLLSNTVGYQGVTILKKVWKDVDLTKIKNIVTEDDFYVIEEMGGEIDFSYLEKLHFKSENVKITSFTIAFIYLYAAFKKKKVSNLVEFVIDINLTELGESALHFTSQIIAVSSKLKVFHFIADYFHTSISDAICISNADLTSFIIETEEWRLSNVLDVLDVAQNLKIFIVRDYPPTGLDIDEISRKLKGRKTLETLSLVSDSRKIGYNFSGLVKILPTLIGLKYLFIGDDVTDELVFDVCKAVRTLKSLEHLQFSSCKVANHVKTFLSCRPKTFLLIR